MLKYQCCGVKKLMKRVKIILKYKNLKYTQFFNSLSAIQGQFGYLDASI